MSRASLILLAIWPFELLVGHQPASMPGVEIRPEKVHFVSAIAAQINRSRGIYQSVGAAAKVPWSVVSALHYREASLDFRTNLAQGDSLNAYSRHVPAGRPKVGHGPPFTWSEAAIDALKFDRMGQKDWSSMASTLDNCEGYNGWGYRKRGVPSPYIYSWTNRYSRGKFVADGRYSPTALDQQCGVYPILNALAH